MLIEFKVKNFRSIYEEQTFSMVSAKQAEHEHTHIFALENESELSLVKTAAIYGANAAGKTSFIRALKTMQEIVVESATDYQHGQEFNIDPYKFNDNEDETEFEIVFLVDDVRYQYGFTLTKKRVIEEWLFAYPKKRPQNWFSRVYNKNKDKYDWKLGDKLTGKKQLWQESTRDNGLFLSTAVQLNSEQLTPIYDWFSTLLHITGVQGWSSGFTVKLCQEEDYKRRVLNFLNTADIAIDDILVEEEEFSTEHLPDDMPDDLKNKISKELKGKKLLKEPEFVRTSGDGRQYSIQFDDESDGTKKLFSFIGPWIDVLDNGGILIVDELHDNFHPLLVQFLVDLFHNNQTNKKNAQLVFTTHETSILNNDTFRRDQIWFCEKQNFSSIIYPLTDFSPRKESNLEKNYLHGRFGALPYFKDIDLAMCPKGN